MFPILKKRRGRSSVLRGEQGGVPAMWLFDFTQSWLSGAARILDIGAVYDDHYLRLTPELADWVAFRSDMMTLRSDYQTAVARFKREVVEREPDCAFDEMVRRAYQQVLKRADLNKDERREALRLTRAKHTRARLAHKFKNGGHLPLAKTG